MERHAEDTSTQANDGAKLLAAANFSEESTTIAKIVEGSKETVKNALGNVLPDVSIHQPVSCDGVSKPGQGMSVEEFQHASLPSELCVYSQSKAGKLPEGNGTAFYTPGTLVGNVLALHGGWGNKIFTQDNTGHGVMRNELLNLNADVAYGPSLLDGKQSIILDYPGHRVRGEMRQTGADDYLGIMYANVQKSATDKGYVPLAMLGVHVDKPIEGKSFGAITYPNNPDRAADYLNELELNRVNNTRKAQD